VRQGIQQVAWWLAAVIGVAFDEFEGHRRIELFFFERRGTLPNRDSAAPARLRSALDRVSGA